MMSLSYKKPVVVSDLPSFKEVVEDKKQQFSSQQKIVVPLQGL